MECRSCKKASCDRTCPLKKSDLNIDYELIIYSVVPTNDLFTIAIGIFHTIAIGLFLLYTIAIL